MQHLLVAIDGSEHAANAVGLAGEIGHKFAVPVTVLNVVPDDAVLIGGATHEYVKMESLHITQREILKAIGRDIVAQAAREIRTTGASDVRERVEVGDPAYTIVDTADKVGADTILMGRRGLTDLKGLFMGSVSHKVGHLTDKTLITTS